MTTITYDGRYFAADTRRTTKHSAGLVTHADDVCKLMIPEKGTTFEGRNILAVATCGYEIIAHYMLELFRTKQNVLDTLRNLNDGYRKEVATLAVLTDNGLFNVYSNGSYIKIRTLPYSVGSACLNARLFMCNSKNAMQAIQEASKQCDYTNDVVDYIDTTDKELVIKRY